MMYKLSRGFTLVLFFDSINRQRIFPEKMKSVILIVVISSFFCVNVYCTEFPFGPSKGGGFGGKCNGIAVSSAYRFPNKSGLTFDQISTSKLRLFRDLIHVHLASILIFLAKESWFSSWFRWESYIFFKRSFIF